MTGVVGARIPNWWVNRAVARQLGLTEGMCEVLCGVASGQTNEQIGRRLFVPAETVKSRLRRLYVVLGVRDRAQAVAVAYDRGALRTAAERAWLARPDADCRAGAS